MRSVRSVLGCVVAITLPLAGCASEVDLAYERCVERTAADEADETDASARPEVAARMRAGTRAMAERSCAIIREQCEPDRRDATCRSLLERWK